MSEVRIYPVGLFRDLIALRTRRFTARTFTRWFRRSWRRRSYWNGYLAEHVGNLPHTRAGHGWTKRRALRDLHRHLAEVAS